MSCVHFGDHGGGNVQFGHSVNKIALYDDTNHTISSDMMRITGYVIMASIFANN